MHALQRDLVGRDALRRQHVGIDRQRARGTPGLGAVRAVAAPCRCSGRRPAPRSSRSGWREPDFSARWRRPSPWLPLRPGRVRPPPASFRARVFLAPAARVLIVRWIPAAAAARRREPKASAIPRTRSEGAASPARSQRAATSTTASAPAIQYGSVDIFARLRARSDVTSARFRRAASGGACARA